MTVKPGLPQSEYVKQWQKLIGIWPSGNFEHQTLARSLEIYEKAFKPSPAPKPEPPSEINPYSVKDHFLYKDGVRVSYKQSPNYNRNMTIDPEIIVIHYTGTPGLASPLAWLTEAGSGVSSHLLISTEGVVWQLLPFNRRAWHAGQSEYDGRTDVNSFSIGIENVGIGAAWPEKQVETIRLVCQALWDAYNLVDIVGHEDVAPGRKVDPGPKFPWDYVRDSWLEYA